MNIFINPQFLAVAGALVSVPIIIHLINRMRFKRIRWAAMEFLLKAQKRKRKRLIIEQLLLLFLRCLLVALIGLLVSRLVSTAFANLGGKPNLHVVLLDDTIGMQEEWKEEGAADPTSAFQHGLKNIVVGKVADAMKTSSPADELVVLPVSRLVTDPDFKPTYHKYLNDESKFKDIKEEIEAIPPSNVHVPMSAAVDKLRELVIARKGSNITLHLVGDYRESDWNAELTAVQKTLAEMTKENTDLYIKILDAVKPEFRDKKTSLPESRDNLAIVDLRSASRVVSKNMPAEFLMKVKNFSSQDKQANVLVYDELSGNERQDVNFRAPMPLRIPAGKEIVVAFELPPPHDTRKDLPYKGGHMFISAKLTSPANKHTPLEDDGLPVDNRRFASVELVEKVPVLLIDGRGQGKKDLALQDWLYIDTALEVAPSANYEVIYGENVGGVGVGVPTNALNRPDLLAKFAGVYLLNVTSLQEAQIKNLEAFVANGGGVCFFMGPEVSKDLYNKELYRGGKGVFPVELTEVVTAKLDDGKKDEGKKGKDDEEAKESQDLLLRDRLYPSMDLYPIFGKLMRDGMNSSNFENINVSKYYRVNRPRMGDSAEAGAEKEAKTWKIQELATLTSEKLIDSKVSEKLGAVLFPRGEDAPWAKVMANDKLKKFHNSLQAHQVRIRSALTLNQGRKVHLLSRPLNALLNDPGLRKDDGSVDGDYPDLHELWSNSDPDVQGLRQQLLDLYDEFAYGDPLVVASNFGRGRSVVVLTTAGQRWSGWGGGSPEKRSAFPVFIEETQKYLSAQGSGSTYTVGAAETLGINTDVFKEWKISAPYRVKRTMVRPGKNKPAELIGSPEDLLGNEKDGVVSFKLTGLQEPGLSVTELTDGATNLVTSVVHVFNIDAMNEGSLQRIASLAPLEKDSRANSVKIVGSNSPADDYVTQQSILSDTSYFFLLLICVLIAEQALAVHLSFHLKGEQLAMPTQAGKVAAPPAQAA